MHTCMLCFSLASNLVHCCWGFMEKFSPTLALLWTRVETRMVIWYVFDSRKHQTPLSDTLKQEDLFHIFSSTPEKGICCEVNLALYHVCSPLVHCLVCASCTDWVQTETSCFYWQTALLKTSHLSSFWQVRTSCSDRLVLTNQQIVFQFIDWLDDCCVFVFFFFTPLWKNQIRRMTVFGSLEWVLSTSVLVFETLTLECVCSCIIRTTLFQEKYICSPQENACCDWLDWLRNDEKNGALSGHRESVCRSCQQQQMFHAAQGILNSSGIFF